MDRIVSPVSVATKEQAVVFLVGDENAVIHSEPRISEPRIFVAILVGSNKQIKEMKVRDEAD